MPGQQNLTKEQEKKIAEIIRTFTRDYSTFTSHFEEIDDGYNYLAGIQFNKSQYNWYEEHRRPARVFNLIFPIFNQILGDFLLNELGIRVYPQPGGTSQIAEAISKLIEHTNIENDIKSVFQDTALAGIVKHGFLYPRFTDENHPDGSVVIRNVDEYEIMWDPAAQDYFLDDAQYVLRTRWLSKEDILHYFPEHKTELEPLLTERQEMPWEGELASDVAMAMQNRDFVNELEGKYRIIEYREMRFEECEVAYDPMTRNSFIWNLEGNKADLFRKRFPSYKIVRRRDKIKWTTLIIPGLYFFLSEKKEELQDKQHDIIPFTAYAYGKRSIRHFGVFRNAKDPQDDYNSWKNQSNAIINQIVNPGRIYNPADFENPEDIENYFDVPGVNIKTDSTKPLKDLMINLSQYYTNLPFAPDKMSLESAEFLQKITNVTNNMFGEEETANEPASLFAQRVRRAQVALQTIYHNWARTKRRLYDKVVSLMQLNYDTQRYFLITNPKTNSQEELVINIKIGDQIVNDIRVGKYYVTTDEIENHPTTKFARFRQKTEVVQMIQQLFGGQAIPPQAILPTLVWWLEDSGLGDIDEFLKNLAMGIQQVVSQTEDEVAQTQAIELTDRILDMTNKRINLSSGGLGQISAPANRGKNNNSPKS